jgi:hypothetical protein
MSRIKQTEVFQYDELSPDAQAKARDWWREVTAGDADSLEHVIEDAATCGAFMGIDLRTHPVKLMGGGMRLEPCVYWSGFSSQGDGACFDGSWTASAMDPLKLKADYPTETELHRISDALVTIALEYPDSVANMTHNGRYSHSGCMDVESDCGIDTSVDDDAEFARLEALEAAFPYDDVRQLLRDFADWIYSRLECEYEWQNADEQVADNIIANGYEFTADGNAH